MSDRTRRTLTAGLLFGGICMGFAFVIRFICPYRFWSFRFGESTREFAHRQKTMAVRSGISVRILDTKQYVPPLAIIPRDAFYGFWQLLHVDADDWNKFHLDRRNGNRIPIAPKFPLLSELADIEIDNIDFPADQIDELRNEIDAVQETHVGRLQNGVLLALSNAAIMVSAENKGLRLSPFG